MANLLLATLVLPLVGAGLAAGTWARMVALLTSLVVAVLAGVLVFSYPGRGEFALTDWAWLGEPVDIRLSVALDGLGLWLFGLTGLLVVVGVLVSWTSITEHASTFYRLLLLLESGMLGVFVARDIILFYVFFEFTLLPLFFLIGIWGSQERRRAAIKFFLFTLSGSVLLFLGLLAIVLWDYFHAATERMTFSIPELTASLAEYPMPPAMATAVFAAMFAGLAIKVPLFPLHTWLPLAHTEAPAAGSVLLAGILLKVGGYGFVRIALPMFPDVAAAGMPWLMGLSVAGILYGALVALAQEDIKRLVAYSSVSHLGFCMLGVFSLSRVGVQGGVLQMVNHGLATGGLFALVGMLYQRYHTRRIDDFGGLARRMPRLATMAMLMTLASIGLPGLGGFVGEFLVLLGTFQQAWLRPAASGAVPLRILVVLATFGVVLGAWYMLRLMQRVFFGPLREPVTEHSDEHPVCDLSLRELAALAPLVVLLFWIGLWPGFFLDRMGPTVDQLMAASRESARAPRVAMAESPGAGDFCLDSAPPVTIGRAAGNLTREN